MTIGAEYYPDFIPEECRSCPKLFSLLEQWFDIQVTLDETIIDCCDTQATEAMVQSWELSDGYEQLDEILPNKSTVERIQVINQSFFEAFSVAANAKKNEIKQAIADCENCQSRQ